MKTYKIHLIRHGMTRANDEGLYIGQTDLPLSPDGFSQLMRMRKSFVYPAARQFYCAPLTRCRQTLEVLYPDCKPVDVAGLSECFFGEWEGKSVSLLKSDPAFAAWIAGKQSEIPGGEAAADFQKRVMEAFEALVFDIFKSHETETIVCVPGGVLMLIMTAYGLPRLSMREWAADSGCGFTLRITPELWMREPVAEALCAIPWSPDGASPRTPDGASPRTE